MVVKKISTPDPYKLTDAQTSVKSTMISVEPQGLERLRKIVISK